MKQNDFKGRMKTLHLLTILIFLFTSACVCAAPQPEILISGVRTADNQFLFDPKPQESEYLRTFQGGFNISKYGARYWALWDIIKDRDKLLYVRIELQNPSNKKQPIVHEGVIPPNNQSLYVASNPISGLKMYGIYRIDVFIYEDEARTSVVDRMTQKVKSYVDTRGGGFLLDKGLMTADGQRMVDVIDQDPAFAR